MRIDDAKTKVMTAMSMWVENHLEEGSLVQLREFMKWVDEFSSVRTDALIVDRALPVKLSGIASRALMLCIYLSLEQPNENIQQAPYKPKRDRRRRESSRRAYAGHRRACAEDLGVA